jgi:NADH:ubiquinone oxidoreductase subunit 4 (subunit M)
LFFYLVDCLYRRYHTRSIVELQGVLHLNPNLAILVFFACVFYSGLPGTLKFLCEFYIFSGLIEASFLNFLFLIYVANFIGLVGFSKCWFNAIFGMNATFQKTTSLDLS